MTISDESKQAARKTLGTTEFYLSLDKMAEIIQQAINLHERDLVEALKKLAALYQSGAGPPLLPVTGYASPPKTANG